MQSLFQTRTMKSKKMIGSYKMKKHIMLFALAIVCQEIDDNVFGSTFMRCENDEVMCYVFTSGYRGGMSCKFKEEQ